MAIVCGGRGGAQGPFGHRKRIGTSVLILLYFVIQKATCTGTGRENGAGSKIWGESGGEYEL